MVNQTDESKMEKFIETMPTMIQTHLIICKKWQDVKDKAKLLEHIVRKCEPPTPALPLVTTGATVPSLYSHITHSTDKEETEIPPPFKGAKPKPMRARGKAKGGQVNVRQVPVKQQESDNKYHSDNSHNYYHNDRYNTTNQYKSRRPHIVRNTERSFRGFRGRGYRPPQRQQAPPNQRFHRQGNRTQDHNSHRPFYNNHQYSTFRGRTHANPHQSRGHIRGRFNYRSNANRQHQYYTHEQQAEQYSPPCSLCGGFNHSPKHCYKGKHNINNIMEKMSINPHQQNTGNLYQ